MLLQTMRLAPLLLLACQGSGEYAREEVSISPRLDPESTPAEPAPAASTTAQAPRTAPRTTPGAAYAGAALGQDGLSMTSNPISTGLVPRSAQQGKDSPRFVKRGGHYEVQAGSGKDRFTWIIAPESTGQLLDIVSIEDDGAEVRPFAGAVATGFGKPEVLDLRRIGDSLEVTYDNNLVQVFTPAGRSLRIDLLHGGGLKRGRADLKTGGVATSGRSKVLDVLCVPYFDIAYVAVLEVDRQARYLTSWVDPMASNAAQILAANPDDRGPNGERGYAQYVNYLTGTERLRRPLRESLWVTWGTEIDEVLPSMDRPASPVRDSLGELFYLSYSNTPFADAVADLEELHGAGLEDLHLWMHHWQNGGYDTGYPDQVFPPRREWGGLVGLQAMSKRVTAMGYGMSLHHNWRFNSTRERGNTLLSADGRIMANSSGGEYLKPGVALELVDAVEQEMHDEIGTVGAFSDSITAAYPIVDQDATTEDWGLLRGTLGTYLEILSRLRAIHGSPIAGEGSLGGGNVLYAGSQDVAPGTLFIKTEPRAVNRNGRFVDMVPHFALGPVHELSVRAGIGQPRRFVAPDRWTTAGGYDSVDRDMTRTVAAVMGNVGYAWWYQRTRYGSVVRDWWGSREVTTALGAPGLELEEVTYFDDRGRGQSLDKLLLGGGDLSIGATRMHLTFAGGAELWANLTRESWRPKGSEETLAPMGHLFLDGPVSAGILVRDGKTVQVSTGPERRWLDARGQEATNGGLGTDGAVGLRPIEAVDGGGWHVFPVAEYTLAMPKVGDEQLARTSYLELTAPLVEPGSYQLVWLDRDLLETHAEVVELGEDGLRVDMQELLRHGARSVRVQPLE